MTDKTDKDDVIWVVTVEQTSLVRGDAEKPIVAKALKITELSANIKQFLEHLGEILQDTSDKIGKFQLDALEVHADISTEGKVSLLGTGLTAGAAGGIKFVFHRLKAQEEEH